MNQNRPPAHPTDPGYDPVLDGVSRGLADLFPPIHTPSYPTQRDDEPASPDLSQDADEE